MVPMLDEAIELAAEGGAHEVVIGMAHRGRLNVLAHVVGRPYETILREFEGERTIDAVSADPEGGTGRRQVPPRRQGRRGGRRRGKVGGHARSRTRATSRRPIRWSRAYTRAEQTDRSHARRAARPDRRAADPDPRRRVVRRPGRGAPRRSTWTGLARLLDRRHAAPDREQPGRLHDRPARRPLDPLLERPRQGLRHPDHPRQRRRRRRPRSPRSGSRWPTAGASATTSWSTSSATGASATTSRTRRRTRSR